MPAVMDQPVVLAYWRCQRCRKKLGELTADHLLVQRGHLRLRIPLRLAAHVERWCERCGEVCRPGVG